LDGVMEAATGAAKNDDAGEGPWALPDGWCWTRTDAVAAINPSTNFDTLDPASEIPFVPMAAVAEETGKIDLSARRPIQSVAKGYVRFREGDVIFAKITPCMENGKVAPVIGLPGGYAAGSTEFHVFRPAAVDQRYLWYWLVGRDFRGRAKRNMSGSAGQLRVPIDWLRVADFPLAPLAEQRRIVARIDALFAEIAEGEAALAAARKGLDTFRRALLKAAVTGELTKDWRADNPVSKTGRDLLACITKERANQGGGTRRVANSAPLDTSILPQLPAGWDWARLGEIAESVRNGTSAAPRAASNQHEILRISAVRPLRIDEAQIRFLDDDQAQAAAVATVETGDLLFTRYNGSADLVGVGAIYRGPKRFYPDKIKDHALDDPDLLPPYTRGRGCNGHPAFPAPSLIGRDKVDASLGRDRAAGRAGCVWRIGSGLHPSRRGEYAAPQDEVCQSLMVRSAAKPRVSNHDARTCGHGIIACLFEIRIRKRVLLASP
jgi:type I restriction enzyme, S subunit